MIFGIFCKFWSQVDFGEKIDSTWVDLSQSAKIDLTRLESVDWTHYFRHFQIPKVLEINWQNMNFKTQKQQRKNAKLNSCLWFLPSICSWEDSSEKWRLSLYATQLLKSKGLIVKLTPWQNSYYVDLTIRLQSFVVQEISSNRKIKFVNHKMYKFLDYI